MTDPWYEAEDSLSIQELAELVGIEDNEDWDDEAIANEAWSTAYEGDLRPLAEDAHLEAAYEDRFGDPDGY